MRGHDEKQDEVFSYIPLEQRIPREHPLRRIRQLVDGGLKEMGTQFEALYARRGRPSIPPERLLRALLLQALYAIRSETQLMEQLDYNLLYRWFVGLNASDAVWDVTVFTKNRERLMEGELSQRLLEAVLRQAQEKNLLSEEHFTVDGTMIQAWASRKSFVPKEKPPERGSGSKGKKLLRDTHESKTDPQARLYKKSGPGESRPSYLGHVMIENRHGLVVAACATQSSTTAEREAALAMLDERGRRPDRVNEQTRRITLGADKLYQEEKFVAELRKRKVIPHIAEYECNPHWPNWLTDEERQDPGMAISQRKRKLVEKVFGWAKLDSIARQMKVRGQKKVDWLFRLVATVANLVRLAKLIPAV
ncbi:MAG: IS5 family transposase [Candidatus Acidiferrales bacterium]|jgi:transposase